jgi:hypothetical protein
VAPFEARENPAVTRELTFKPGRVYEVTGIWVKQGKLDELNAYFGKVFPIAAQDYSVEPLFSLDSASAYAGEFMPHLFFVNQWPSLEKFKAFLADPRAKALFPERDALVSRLVVTQYAVPQPATVTLKEGDVVEFAAMWVKSGHESELQRYYQEAFPLAKQHGVHPITPLKPVFSYRGDFLPSQAALNLWGSKESFNSFVADARHLSPSVTQPSIDSR